MADAAGTRNRASAAEVAMTARQPSDRQALLAEQAHDSEAELEIDSGIASS